MRKSSATNLKATDIIHFVTAGESKCNIILTSDDDFISEGTRFLKMKKEDDKLKFCKPIEKNVLDAVDNLTKKVP